MTLSSSQIWQLKTLRGNGFSQQEIAEILGVPQSAVSYHLIKLRENYKQVTAEELLIESLTEVGVTILKTILKPRKRRLL